jgi:hypothetical protein
VDRLGLCLERLAPHVDWGDVALTGSLALEHHLPGSRAEIADLDLVARRMEAVAPTVAADFLISHRHVPGPGVPKAMLQLVDPLSRMRVDVFPDLAGIVGQAIPFTLGPKVLQVVRAEDLLAHKLQTVQRASAARPADPKHWLDAQRLARRLGSSLPDMTLHLAAAVHSPSLAPCERCSRSLDPAFPPSPKTAILDVLGYV